MTILVKLQKLYFLHIGGIRTQSKTYLDSNFWWEECQGDFSKELADGRIITVILAEYFLPKSHTHWPQYPSHMQTESLSLQRHTAFHPVTGPDKSPDPHPLNIVQV